jgi:hypothetical protein
VTTNFREDWNNEIEPYPDELDVVQWIMEERCPHCGGLGYGENHPANIFYTNSALDMYKHEPRCVQKFLNSNSLYTSNWMAECYILDLNLQLSIVIFRSDKEKCDYHVYASQDLITRLIAEREKETKRFEDSVIDVPLRGTYYEK